MQNELSKYNSYIVKGILATNQFEIEGVQELESIHSRCFIKTEYAGIESLIKEKNVDAIKKLRDNQYKSDEYLDILTFKDQCQSPYIVTIYDSNALEQDPQVIEIYSL
jgi:hypothetical protein